MRSQGLRNRACGPVTAVVVGAGSRGTTYASYALQHPEELRIVGVADPREFYRERVVRLHGIPQEHVFTDWRPLAARERLADAVIIATPDSLHLEPALALAPRGYAMLLEKPLAPTEEDCRRISEAALGQGILFAACHVLRYTPYTRRLKELLDAGLIGEVVSLQHLEPVGYWHQAHSFVRGNWRRADQSSFMLLAKSCHDLDWIRYVMGGQCVAVASFGELRHFRASEQPTGAAERCLECSIEARCPYSAQKIYLGAVARGETGWPTDILVPEVSEDSVRAALASGPYGRCVYACDNDVVDNQVVSMLFAGGRTASFTMTAFTEKAQRQTRLFGTRGAIEGDGSTIRHLDFLTDTWHVIETHASDASIIGGHGGGDHGLMQAFVRAVREHDPRHILSGAEETMLSHALVFAAETARRERRVVDLLRDRP